MRIIDLINLAESLNSQFSLSHAGVIWTAGTKPSFPTGLPQTSLQDGKILINSKLEVLGCENIFAIGDITLDPENPVPATAQVAMQQGEHLAKNLIYRRSCKSLTSFQFLDRGEMLSMGIGEATLTGMGLTV